MIFFKELIDFGMPVRYYISMVSARRTYCLETVYIPLFLSQLREWYLYNKNKIIKMAKTSSRTDLENYLNSLGYAKPGIHVNGKDHPTALVVVDFGTPLEAVRLTSEQGQELASKLRRFARELVSKDANVRVSSDNYCGVIYYASYSH